MTNRTAETKPLRSVRPVILNVILNATAHAEFMEFFAQEKGNAWFKYGPMRVYLRIGRRNRGRCLTISTVVIDRQSQRGKTVFKQFLRFCEEHQVTGQYDSIFVENIMEPRLVDFLQRKDYVVLTSGMEDVPCMEKIF